MLLSQFSPSHDPFGFFGFGGPFDLFWFLRSQRASVGSKS